MAATVRKIVSTNKAPAAIGAYSQAVIIDKVMYLSGQIGMDPKTSELVPGGAAAEAEQALKNMGEILTAGGSSYFKVVKASVLLADINDFGVVNEVYSRYFTQRLPARAAYQAAALPKGAKVEIEATAVVGEIIDE